MRNWTGIIVASGAIAIMLLLVATAAYIAVTTLKCDAHIVTVQK